ncbi:MAG: hypothetical protein RR182_04895 [Alistipes sp.]
MTQLTQRKPVGGITAVGITPSANVVRVIPSDGTSERGIVLRDNTLLREVPLLEDRSCYTRLGNSTEGLTRVHHILTLVLCPEVAQELIDTCPLMSTDGVVALVTAATGEKIIVGRSEKFGGTQPLRLHTSRFDSGCKRTDPPTTSLSLECDDTE